MSIDLKGKLAGSPDWAEIDVRHIADSKIDFGKAVQYTADDQTLELYDGSGYFAGIAMEANEKIDEDDTRSYDGSDTMKVLKKGIAYVELSGDVNAGGSAGVDSGNANFTDAGTGDDVGDMEFLESGTSGDEVRLRINLPG